MRLVWLFILGVFMIWPVSSTVATVGDKPIDLMLSDALYLLMPATYFFVRSKPSKAQLERVKGRIRVYALTPILALIFIVYASALAGIGLGSSGEMVRLFSAFKLLKPISFVFLGMLIGSWTDPFDFFDMSSRVYGIIVGLTMICTMTTAEFPLGEWGRYIFEFELSGYPNSPMSFYAALVPLLLAAVDTSKSQLATLIGWGLAGCSALIILGSMSRSSSMALIIGVVVYLIITGRVPFLIASVLTIGVLSIVGFGLFSMLRETEMVNVLVDRVQERVDRSTEAEDPSSGRFEIWALAIELAIDRPVFGYMFESFSRYADVDTPHQQYLEVLHKCGGLGLMIYLAIIGSFLLSVRRLQRMTARGTRAWYYLHALVGMFFGVMIGNLTQPNLTFSLTGDMVFLLFGCLCGTQAMISASQPRDLPIAAGMLRETYPVPRLAA